MVSADDRGEAHPFVGREHESAALRRAIDHLVGTGVGSCHAVTGPRGVGKTRFVRRLLTESADSVNSIFVRCWDDDGAPPLWPWPEALAHLDDNAPTDGLLASGGSRFDAGIALRRHLLTVKRPTVIVIDDIHAARADSLSLTRMIAGQLEEAPIVLVLTARSDDESDIGAVLATVAATGSVHELTGLSIDEVGEYIRRTDSDADPVAMHRRSSGNPLFLHHLLGHRDDDTVPPAIEALVRPMIDTLGYRDRATLEALSVFGVSAPVALLATIALVDVDAVEQLVRHRPDLVVGEAHSVRFTHETVREVLAGSMSHVRRLDVHARCVDALDGSDQEFELRRVHHALGVAARSDEDAERAVRLAREVAATLPTLAFEQRADLLRRAIDVEKTCLLREVSASDRLAHADATLASGHLADARELYRGVTADAARSGDARILARSALGLGGVWVEDERHASQRRVMLEYCSTALALLGDSFEEQVLQSQLRVRVDAEAFYEGDHDRDVRPHIEVLRRLGDDRALAESLSLLHHTMLTPEHAQERLVIADEMVAAASRAGSDLQQVLGMCWRTVDLYLLGDPGADRALEDTRLRADTLGSSSVSYMLRVIDVMRRARHADLDGAEVDAAEVFAVGEQVGDADALGYFGGQMAAIGWLKGTWGEMLDSVAAIAQSPTLREQDTIYPAMHATLLAEHRRFGEARGIIASIVARGLDSIARNGNWLSTMCCLVEAARLLDDADLAERLLPILTPFVDLPTMPSLAVFCLGPVARYTASAAATAGDIDGAIAHIEHARAVNHRLQNLPSEALIIADHADYLRRRGRTGDGARARQLLGEAIERARRFGLDDRRIEWSTALEDLDAMEPSAEADVPEREPVAVITHADANATFRRRGAIWRITIDGSEISVKHGVGVGYLAELLMRPGIEIAAVDLARVEAGRFESRQPALDEAALADYRQRLEQIDAELDEIATYHDLARTEALSIERDALLTELKRNLGLHARVRTLPSDVERARSRVSKALRRTIDRLGQMHAPLGFELTTTIRTGQLCSYQPTPNHERTWSVSVDG